MPALLRNPLLRLVLLWACLGCASGCRHRPVPRAHQGVLDLTSYDLFRQGPVPLAGDWAFYWGRFLDPEAFRGEPAPDGWLQVPGGWKGTRLGGVRLGGTGFATLRLRVRPATSLGEPLALRLHGLASAYRIWVDGRLLEEGGRIGSALDQEVMVTSSGLVALPLEAGKGGRQLEIVLQVSNFHLADGRFPPITLGRATDQTAAQLQLWGLGLLAAGALLLMGVYHLVLFAYFPGNRAPLLFGLYCLLSAGAVLTVGTSEWSAQVLVPGLSGPFLARVSKVCYALALPLSYQFFRSLFPQEFPKWVQGACWGVALPFAGLYLMGSTYLASLVHPFLDLGALAKLLFSAGCLALAWRRGRQGAGIILAGYGLLGLLSLNDLLLNAPLVRVPLLHLGLMLFLLSQAFALCGRFSGLFTAVERLSVDLAGKNRALESEVAQRARLEDEVVAISEEERRRVSRDLHDGLCQQLTGARLQCQALACLGPQEASGREEMGRLMDLLESAVDDAYRLSHGLWPVEPGPEGAWTALEELVHRDAQGTGVRVRFRREKFCATCVHPHLPGMYRIAQEAVGNALRHSQASVIEVGLSCRPGGEAVITVQDDGLGPGAAGQGASSDRGGLGLRMMAHVARSMGGTFEFRPRQPRGTLVRCAVACRAADPVQED